MNKIFFYGLFMDRGLLTEKGLHPEVIGSALLSDYRIHIGKRATLLRSPGSRAYGIVMELSEEDARALYSAPSVRDYVPERVRPEFLDSGAEVEADCYNLPRDSGLAGTSPGYAAELARLVETLGFDAAYRDEIAAYAEGGGPTKGGGS